jgi:ubiquinone/menaquinone biosynthesis C-methylase UbiE
LPFASGSFDVAICSLLLHHLSPADAVTTLAEMRRVARRGLIVNDLMRTWFGYLGAVALSRAFTTNPLTRHDAPLSVQRAYTTEEMAQLAREAGLGAVTFFKSLGYRTAMIAEVGH